MGVLVCRHRAGCIDSRYGYVRDGVRSSVVHMCNHSVLGILAKNRASFLSMLVPSSGFGNRDKIKSDKTSSPFSSCGGET
jgi:hypothetical protein